MWNRFKLLIDSCQRGTIVSSLLSKTSLEDRVVWMLTTDLICKWLAARCYLSPYQNSTEA